MTFDESLRDPDGNRTRYVLIDSEVSLPSDLKTNYLLGGGFPSTNTSPGAVSTSPVS